MNSFFLQIRFRAKWLILAIIVFSLFSILKQRDRHFSQQWAKPDIPEYSPFEVPHFTISIKPEDYQFLFSDKPDSLFTYQKAEVSVNRQPVAIKADFRIRGTHSWNWDPAKPSFRLRQSGKRRILGRSNLNIVLPDDPSMLANMVSDNIASEIGIPSPRTMACTVNLNDDYKGLYHLAEPINPESMSWQGYKNIILIEGNSRDSRMWQNHKYWEIQILPGQNPEHARDRLSEMLKIIQVPVKIEQIEKLIPMFYEDRMASWSALLTAIASIHSNDFFGNFFALDQLNNKLFPVLADSTGFGVLTAVAGESSESEIKMPPYEMLTPLLNSFFRIPEFQFARNRALFLILQNQLHPDKTQKLTDQFMQILIPFFKNDPKATALMNAPALHFPIKVPVSFSKRIKDHGRLLKFMSERRKFLLNLLNASLVTIQPVSKSVNINNKEFKFLCLSVSGHSPVSLDFSGMQEFLFPDLNHDGTPDQPPDSFYSVQNLHPALEEAATSNLPWLQLEQRAAGFILVPASQTYLLAARNDKFDEVIAFIQNSAHNAITSEKVSVRLIETTGSFPDRCDTSLHSWRKF